MLSKIHHSFCIFLCLAVTATGSVMAKQADEGEGARSTDTRRTMPPTEVSCDRNQLTTYSGMVIRYSRDPGAVLLTIRTDWDTVESLSIELPEQNPTGYFLLNKQAFNSDDWRKIETAPGKLKPEMRVTAWVCEDGETPAVIDWRPASLNAGRPETAGRQP